MYYIIKKSYIHIGLCAGVGFVYPGGSYGQGLEMEWWVRSALTASCGTVSSVSTALCSTWRLLIDMLLMDRECVWREEGSFCVRIEPSSFTSPFGGGVLRCMAAGIRLTPEDTACRNKIDEYVRTWTPRWPEIVKQCGSKVAKPRTHGSITGLAYTVRLHGGA